MVGFTQRAPSSSTPASSAHTKRERTYQCFGDKCGIGFGVFFCYCVAWRLFADIRALVVWSETHFRTRCRPCYAACESVLTSRLGLYLLAASS